MFRGSDGRRIPFPFPEVKAPAVQPSEAASLHLFPASDLPWKDLAGELKAGALAVQMGPACTLLFDARDIGGVHDWRGVADRMGELIRVFPGRDGWPESLADADGNTLHLIRGRANLLAEIRFVPGNSLDAPLSLAYYRFSAADDLIEVRDLAGLRTYDYKNHLLVRHTDRCGAPCTSRFDNQGRCIETSGPGQVGQRRYEYDPTAHETAIIDSLGNRSIYRYSDAELVIETVDPLGGVSQFDYDAQNRLVLATDQLGCETTLCYAADGNQAGKIQPDGSCMHISNSLLGDVASISGPTGIKCVFERDDIGRIVAKTLPGQGTYRILHNANGSLAVTLPGGKRVVTVSREGRTRITESDEHGLLNDQQYDIWGRLTLLTEAGGATSQYRYNAAGFMTERVNPDGTRRTFDYDPEGRLSSIRDETGALTQWTFDDAGRYTSVILPNGGVLSFRFDTENRLTGIRDLNGAWHSFGYDERGWLVWQQFTDGRLERYGYDARGYLSQMVNPDGSEVTVDRDKVGRIAQIHFPDGSIKTAVHDPAGNWVDVQHAGHGITRELNDQGQFVKESQDEYILERVYSEAGELVSLTDSLGRTVQYGYSDENHVSTVTAPRGSHRFRYDRAGNLTEWLLPGGTIEHRQYDVCRRMVLQRVERNGKRIIDRTYTYDAMGRVIKLTDAQSGARSFEYDALGRLRSWRHGSQGYVSYDAAGDLMAPGLGYSSAHKAVNTAGSTLGYDARGFVVERTASKGRDEFTYLTYGLINNARLANGTVVEFEYDPHYRLLRRRVNGNDELYYWNGDQLSARRELNGSLTEFLYLPNAMSPFEMSVAHHTYSLHCDGQGKIHTMLSESGEVVWRASDDPWLRGPADPLCPLGFPGQILEPETGFYYNRYRFYNPEAVHYTSPDPLGIWPGMDSYRYPFDPVNFIDPLGLKCRGKNDDPTLYRGDSRPPDEICKNGFTATDPTANISVYKHVNGPPPKSNWISTTHDINTASREVFAKGKYVYVIDNPGCGVEVDCDPEVMAQYGPDPKDSEHEIAFNKALPPGKIKGFYPATGGGGLGPFQACP